MANSVVTQHVIQIADSGTSSNSIVSQHIVQVLMESPEGIRFQDVNCTDICSNDSQTSTTESGISWAILDNSDASAVTSILDQGDNLALVTGEGFITTGITPGTYIVIIQGSDGKVAAHVLSTTT